MTRRVATVVRSRWRRLRSSALESSRRRRAAPTSRVPQFQTSDRCVACHNGLRDAVG